MDNQQVLNDAVQELGNKLIAAVQDFSENGETIAALVEVSTTEGGTPEAERCAITIMPMAFTSILSTIPGTNDMRSLLLAQLASFAFQKSQELGAKNASKS